MKRGFTLIELLISISLGAGLAVLAFSSLRLAGQASAAATRMSIENAVMRAGFLRAHEELDFWTDYDDPDLAYHPLSGPSLPFAPLATPLVRNAPAHADDPASEDDRGWDERYRWSVSDPRTWLRANLAERWNSNLAFGRYGMFWNTDGAPAQIADPAKGGAYGSVTVAHTWLANQLWQMQDCIGFYGFADYVPADTIFACSRPFTAGMPGGFDPVATRAPTSPGGITYRMIYPGNSPPLAPNTLFEPGEGSTEVPKSLWRLTMPAAYIVPQPDPSANATTMRARSLSYVQVGYQVRDEAHIDDLLAKAQLTDGYLPLLPSTWPKPYLRVLRMIKTRRFVNLCKVGYTSPITGERLELSFTGYGTTLRGARQQRANPAAGGGWATWGNATRGAPAPITLDTAQP